MQLRVPVAAPRRRDIEIITTDRRGDARRGAPSRAAARRGADRRCVAAMAAAPPRSRTRSCSAPRPRPGPPSRPAAQVIFQFNQNVGGTLGAVRVYNAQGEEVDNLDVSHPQGNEHWMGVGPEAGAPGRHLHGDLSRHLGGHAHRLRGLRVQHRASGRSAEVHRRGPDQQEQERQSHPARLRRGPGAGLPGDRTDGRAAWPSSGWRGYRHWRPSRAPSRRWDRAAGRFGGRTRCC